jgi:ankyrin repeat protein
MYAKTVGLALLLTVTAAAQAPDGSDRFYQAIRNDDLATLGTLLREADINTKDRQGETPLMMAAAFGSPEAVRLLLTHGADARAASSSGVTALHWAAASPAKVRLLLEAAVDVNALSQIGRTPLIVASSASGSAEAVRLLLAKGAKVNVADDIGITPLSAASIVDDGDVVKLLLASKADVNMRATTGQAATPLMGAATNGNLDVVSTLLDGGANPNTVSGDSAATVKNGPIQFGRVTALHFAVLSGNPKVVRRLLAAGATVDAADIRGMTPLMLAIATDRPEPSVVRMLVDAGANPTARSKANETAIDWARKFNHPGVLTALKLSPPKASAVKSTTVAPIAAHASTPRLAVERSLPLMRDASARMLTSGGCVACHAQPLTGIAVTLAKTRGWTAVTADPQTSVAFTTLQALAAPLTQLRDGGGLPDGLVYVAWLAATAGVGPTRTTDALLHFLAAKQRPDGSWEGVGGSRAPMQDGNFSRTALSVRALTAYATPARRAEYEARVQRAAAWLAARRPTSTEDRVMQLLGLHWADAEPRLRQARVQELLAAQRADGGWAQTPYLDSDAYATGQALFTLRQLGVPAADRGLQRGTAYLQRTQAGDGTWHVVNRAMKVQPYFESGFPYGHDQWISHAGTAWAVMGLASAGLDAAPASAAR